MAWLPWVIVGLVLIAAVWLLWYLFAYRRPKQEPAAEKRGNVCDVWDRWALLRSRQEVPTGRTLLGSAWENGNTCPAGALFQQINRREVACVPPEDREEATKLICHNHISNNDIAQPSFAVSEPGTSCCDHFVQLSQGIDFEAGTRKGSAWIGSLCPEGALFQLLEDNEMWCVLPEDALSTVKTLQ